MAGQRAKLKSRLEPDHFGIPEMRSLNMMDCYLKGDRVILPTSMRPEMLQIIHRSHLGIEKCKQRAKDILYWPGMATQI